jgi:biotin carboxyl carrier protein
MITAMENHDDLGILNIDSGLYKTRISIKYRKRVPYKPADPNMLMSFIPGTVLEILVSEGQQVKKGEELLILDAMKMQNSLKSTMDGKIKSIAVKTGDRVAKGVLLIEME